MPKIYESPDGGKTIYAREIGDSDKILISEFLDNSISHREIEMWKNILELSKHDEELLKTVEHAKLLYYLKHHGSSET